MFDCTMPDGWKISATMTLQSTGTFKITRFYMNYRHPRIDALLKAGLWECLG